MKWIKRIVGFLIGFQCIGLYSAALDNMHRQAINIPNGGTGKTIYFTVIGTIFLVVGIFLIWSSFKSRKEVLQSEN